MDGTLVDNIKIHFLAFAEMSKRYNIVAETGGDFSRLNGRGNEDIITALFPAWLIEQKGVEGLGREKEEVYREMYHDKVEPIAGLIEFLKAAKAAGVKCALGSSGCRDNVNMIIDRLGIADYVDASISGSDVTHGKPHPEIFTKAHEAMGLKAEECIVVEDAVNGILAGVAAGCKCLAITTTATAEELTKAGADMCVEDYSTVTIDDLNALLN